MTTVHFSVATSYYVIDVSLSYISLLFIMLCYAFWHNAHTVSNIKWPPSIKEYTVFGRLDSGYEFSEREGQLKEGGLHSVSWTTNAQNLINSYSRPGCFQNGVCVSARQREEIHSGICTV